VGATDETLFGENVNRKGPGELRLAWAERQPDDSWQVNLVPEPRRLAFENLPSRNAFLQFRQQLIEEKTNAVFYIHGYNQAFVDTLEQADLIQELYGVGVVMFSWPSNPGGFISIEYHRAKAIAESSAIAIDRTFEAMGRYFRDVRGELCEVSFNLLVHSLGNYLFEHFIRSPIFAGETRFFDNIILNAADVDLFGHNGWIDKLKYSTRVYATINERDRILAASDAINIDRLGNTVRNLKSEQAIYMDLTHGKDVEKKHQHFGTTALANENVKKFFEAAFAGRPAQDALGEAVRLNEQNNTYEIL